MKYETIFIIVRAMVHSDHTRISDTVRELESQPTLLLTDTANINVLELKYWFLGSRMPKYTDVQSLSNWQCWRIASYEMV